MSEVEKGTVALNRMTKAEAQKEHDLIVQEYEGIVSVGKRLLRMRDERGYEALGFASFNEYGKSLADSVGARPTVYRHLENAEVSRSLGDVSLPLRQSMLLAKVPEIHRAEVYKAAGSKTATEKTIEKALARFHAVHGKGSTAAKKGWTKVDLEADPELSRALDKIGSIYGEPARGAIQRGTVFMKRSELLELAAMTPTQIKSLQHLLMDNRWSLSDALAFIEDEPTVKSTTAEWIDWCLANKGEYTYKIGGCRFNVKKA